MPPRAMLLPLLLVLILAPAAVRAAPDPAAAAPPPPVTLRAMAVVEGPVLRLGDLFEGIAAPERAAATVGAAPLPGRRLMLEAAQLAAIARAHGLPWRPMTAQDRAVLERPGRALPRAEIEAALRAELMPLGLDPEAALDLGGLIPPMVPPVAAVTLGAEAASLEAAAGPSVGRFAATLVVASEGMPTQRLRVAGRAVPTVPAVVATRRLALGEVVGPGDLRPVRLRAELARPGQAQQPEQVVGRQLRRPMAGEQPFTLADLAAPTLVERNALVTLLVDAPGLQLTAQGRALEAAGRGAVVPVMNLASRMVVEGVVVGPGRVRVSPGATPVAQR